MIYLVSAANAMYPLLTKYPPRAKDTATAASIGCTTLRNLADDHEFRGYVRELSRRQLADSEGFNSITGRGYTTTNAWDHYLTNFLGIEKRVMLDGGFDSQLVEELLQQSEQLIQPVRSWDGDADSLFVKISQVRDDACNLAASLNQNLNQKKEDEVPSDTTKRHVQRIMYAVVGGAIVVLNAVPYFHPMLSDIGTAVSGALGNAFVSLAIPAP